jgi:hypothetical protein
MRCMFLPSQKKGSTGGVPVAASGMSFVNEAPDTWPTQLVSVNGVERKQLLSWAANGTGLFVTHEAKVGSELMYVDHGKFLSSAATNNCGG